MNKLTKSVAVLFIIAMVFGCASSKSSTTTATGAEQKPMEAPSATIHLEEWHVMALLGGDWGHGTLGYNGKTYKFKATGMGAGGLGVQKISATGDVYHLKDIADFPGKYSELRAGIDVVKGVGGYYIHNDKGVVIKLKTHDEGVALSVGVEGMTFQLVDDK
jgi:hypothetical protein